VLVDVSVFGRHPILLPPPARTFSVPRKAPAEAKLTWTLNPDTQVVKVGKFTAACVDPLDDDDPARAYLAGPEQGVAVPVVAIIPSGLAAPKGSEDLVTKPTPVEVSPDRLLGGRAGGALPSLDFHRGEST
jgi:hypothetical protein